MVTAQPVIIKLILKERRNRTLIKGIKLRLYPNATQRAQLWQMFGNTRFVWNQMLAMANTRYANNPKSTFVGEYDMNYLLKQLKVEYPFLKESDSSSLIVVNHNLAQAFKMLFKKQGGHPKFKSRNNLTQSYTGRSTCKIIAKRRMQLPKLGSIRTSKTSHINDLVNHNDFKVKQYTISHDATGHYYLSLQVETTITELPKTDKVVGIDLGIADLAITSNGDKYTTFNSDWNNKQAIAWQRKFSKRKHRALVKVRQYNHNHKDTKLELEDYQNWQRARQTKARYQTNITRQRHDYLHKITTELVKTYDVIVIEDLKAKNLLKNHNLASSISNASWYQFRTMLEYKCAWYGKQLVIVSPKYTSQICSNCGFNSGKKSLDVREWTCPHCHKHHDRDINAAVNILNQGLKLIG